MAATPPPELPDPTTAEMPSGPVAVIYLYQSAAFPAPTSFVMPATPDPILYPTPVAVAYIYLYTGAATDPLPDAPAPDAVPFALGYMYGDPSYSCAEEMGDGARYGRAFLRPLDAVTSASIVKPGGVVGPDAKLYAAAYIAPFSQGFLYALPTPSTTEAVPGPIMPQGSPYAVGFLYPSSDTLDDWAPPLVTVQFLRINSLAELEQQELTADEVMITLDTIGPISNLQELVWIIRQLSDKNPGWAFTQYHLICHVNRFAEALSELRDGIVPGLSANPGSNDAQLKAMQQAERLKSMAKGLKRFGLKKVCNSIANRLHRIVQRVRNQSKERAAGYLEKSLDDFVSLVHDTMDLPVKLP